MKATFTATDSNNVLSSHRAENIGFDCWAIVRKDNGTKPIEARFYCPGRATQWSCCVWINVSPYHLSGSGKTSGFGYEKQSAALADALARAGVKLSEYIGGTGEQSIPRALAAVATACGLREKEYLIVHVHP